MVSRAQQHVAPNGYGIQSNPPRQLMNLRERDAALPLRHPTACLSHRECHKYADIVRNGLMQTMPYPCPAVASEDHDIHRPAGFERLPLHLEESLLNSDLIDDAIANPPQPRPVLRRPADARRGCR